MFRTNSFLKRTVITPEMAFTTVDFPCATWPIVPIGNLTHPEMQLNAKL